MNAIKITKGKYQGKTIGDLNFMQLVSCAKDLGVFVEKNSTFDMKEAIAKAMENEAVPVDKSEAKPAAKEAKVEESSKKDDKPKDEKPKDFPQKDVTKEAQAIVDATSHKKVGSILNAGGLPKGKSIYRSEAVRKLTALKYGRKQIAELIGMHEKDVYNVLWHQRRNNAKKAEQTEASK